MKATVLLLFASFTVFAKDPQPTYQDAILKSYRTVFSGQHCSGNTSSNINCSNTETAYYTITVGEQIFVLEPTLSGKGKAGAFLSLGWSAALAKNSCLYGQLPGTHILIRSDGGTFHVKLGKRESIYKLVAAD